MTTNDKWRGRKVLVTGAGGFIGSHLVERLVELGADVTAFFRYNSSGSLGLFDMLPLPAQENVRVLFGDLCDPSALDAVDDDVEVVFHLAAIIAIPFSYRQPALVADNNIRSTMNVLEWCRHRKIARLVNTSSSEVYGTAQQDFITEAHPQEAQSPYAASKAASDHLVRAYHHTYGLNVTTSNCSNNYGPFQFPEKLLPLDRFHYHYFCYHHSNKH